MIILIMFVGLVLRLLKLDQSLWLDEGISVIVSRSLSYKSLVINFAPADFHPPLFYILLKAWMSVFGSSEISARALPVIFGVASIALIYFISKIIFDNRTALVAAVLLATSPLHIYYSQEARMYMQEEFFVLLSIFFFVNLVNKDKLVYWIGFIVSTVLLLYTDYLPALLILSYALFIVKNKKIISKEKLRSFIPAGILIFTFILPLFVLFLTQLKSGLKVASLVPAWASIVGGSSFKDLALIFIKFTIGRISIDNNVVYMLIFAPIALFILILILISALRQNKQRSFLWYWLLVPIAVTFVVSFFVPVFSYFRLIFVLPAFYVILASAVTNLNWSLPTRILLGVLLAINLTCSIIYFWNPKFQRENWRDATVYIEQSSSKDSIALFESTSVVPPFEYYNLKGVKAAGILDSFSPNPSRVASNVQAATSGKNKVFLFQYLSPITDNQGYAFKSLTDQGFINTKTSNFEGVGFIYEFIK